MSTFAATTDPAEAPAAGQPGTEPFDVEGRDVPLGRYTVVRRYLPDRALRTIGAWCFLDRIGPHAAADHPAMWVPPHPHIGLQTVTWLTEGEVLHRDSIGSLQLVRAGELGIMTAGAGIAHSEESPSGEPMSLAGVQLWVALPSGELAAHARYAYHADLPRYRRGGLEAVVFVGRIEGSPDDIGTDDIGTDDANSPAVVHSPLLGAELRVAPQTSASVPLDPRFEHGLLTLEGTLSASGHTVAAGTLHYLPTGATKLELGSEPGARAVLIGGEPFREHLVMWWNFVGRSHEDIVAARDAWEADRQREAGEPLRFAEVVGFRGEPLPAPPLPPLRLLPRDQHGRRADG